ncbi:hypothetical protein [Kushneria aurantia]|uniref:Uncharacterized protein n=1 Tax=Kushneria aurantia TaxID=504092 RepID=A0ABV6G2V6_9GAMM|nr:hypothetical protein [Kushneria aurantia]
MNNRDDSADATPLLLTEKRLNTTLLGVAFAFSMAGAITLMVHAWQSGRVWPVVPIALGLLAWGLMIGNNLSTRRRLSPVLRLEAQRLRYIGGPAWKPRLVDIDYRNIAAVEKRTGSAMVLRLHSERRRHLLPIGLLSRADRQRFIDAFEQRLPATAHSASSS